jgi:hypothetical protein
LFEVTLIRLFEIVLLNAKSYIEPVCIVREFSVRVPTVGLPAFGVPGAIWEPDEVTTAALVRVPVPAKVPPEAKVTPDVVWVPFITSVP